MKNPKEHAPTIAALLVAALSTALLGMAGNAAAQDAPEQPPMDQLIGAPETTDPVTILLDKEEALQKQEMSLQEKEAALAAKEQELQQAKDALAAKEQELQAKADDATAKLEEAKQAAEKCAPPKKKPAKKKASVKKKAATPKPAVAKAAPRPPVAAPLPITVTPVTQDQPPAQTIAPAPVTQPSEYTVNTVYEHQAWVQRGDRTFAVQVGDDLDGMRILSIDAAARRVQTSRGAIE